jgi:hypothetical protein
VLRDRHGIPFVDPGEFIAREPGAMQDAEHWVTGSGHAAFFERALAPAIDPGFADFGSRHALIYLEP